MINKKHRIGYSDFYAVFKSFKTGGLSMTTIFIYKEINKLKLCRGAEWEYIYTPWKTDRLILQQLGMMPDKFGIETKFFSSKKQANKYIDICFNEVNKK